MWLRGLLSKSLDLLLSFIVKSVYPADDMGTVQSWWRLYAVWMQSRQTF